MNMEFDGKQDPGDATGLAPDPVIEAYKKDVDRTLLRENLKRSPTERVQNLMALQRLAEEARRAARKIAPSHSPYLRGAPRGLPFRWDEATLHRGLNFTLTTTVGDIDLLGEITGGRNYEAILPHTVVLDLFGRTCRCLDLPTLILVKLAAGRPKDLEVIAELQVLLEERGSE